MPVTIIKGDKTFKFKPLEDEEFEIEYKRISDRSILRCVKIIVGDSIDLFSAEEPTDSEEESEDSLEPKKLKMFGMNFLDFIDVSTELLEQAVIGWTGLYEGEDDNLEEVPFDKELIEFLPMNAKSLIGVEIMNLLTKGAEPFTKKSTKSRQGKKNKKGARKKKVA